jgi:hypothetical protein
MKNHYLSFLMILALPIGLSAQLTLTKANNEPVSGSSWTTREFDSTAAVPKNTGTGQLWNFNAMASTNQTNVVTYTTAASAPGSSLFPNATLAELKSGSETGFYNTGGANFEFLGFYDPNGPTSVYLSNSAIMAAWPISYGSSNSDGLSGTMTSGTMNVAWTGNITVTAPGSGTVILPGGNTLNSCLLVVSNVSIAMGTTTYSEKNYSFFSAGNRFPVVEFAYESSTTGTVTTKQFIFRATLSLLPVGIRQADAINSGIKVYPNPVKDLLMITGDPGAAGDLELLDLTGKSVWKGSAAGTIDLRGLHAGLYFLVIQNSSGTTVKRIVLEP